MSDERLSLPSAADAGWTRRTFLTRGSQLAALAVAGPTVLAACGSSSSGSTKPGAASSAGAGTPVRGGSLIVGMVGTGAAETVNPMIAVSIADIARTSALFDPFFAVGPDIKTLVPMLATKAESNADATVWTYTLRSGVTWHDGKPFTADDAVYSIKALASPKDYGAGLVGGLVDFKNVRKQGPLTVVIPLLSPNANLPALLTGANVAVFQNGATAAQLAHKPIGTGPFTFQSFTPGTQSVFLANKNYWDHGKPYVEKLVIDSSFSDVVAQVNALQSGQINVLPQLPYAQVSSLKSAGGISILQSPGVAAQYFKMRVDKGPLVDQRVRMALQLVTDRQALITGALNGFGSVAYDLMAPKTQYFASDLTRQRDVDQAKSLLSAAGQSNLVLPLSTSNAFPGSIEAATLFAFQAKDAGIKVQVKTLTAAALATAYVPAPFANAYTIAEPSIDAVYRGLMASNAVYPETGWGNPQHDAAVAAAVAATDPTKAAGLWHGVQETWFNGGPYIVWGYADNIDAVGSKVRGLTTTAAGNLNNFRFQDGWVSS
jgi:peptide/nickel transport system substrate-binding protein